MKIDVALNLISFIGDNLFLMLKYMIKIKINLARVLELTPGFIIIWTGKTDGGALSSPGCEVLATASSVPRADGGGRAGLKAAALDAFVVITFEGNANGSETVCKSCCC